MDDQFSTESSFGAVCDDCGEPLSPDATFCPNCGSRRMSKSRSVGSDLPFQYVPPKILQESYTYIGDDFDFYESGVNDDYRSQDFSEKRYASKGYDENDYSSDDYGSDDYERDYSDYRDSISYSPAAGRRSSGNRPVETGRARRSPTRNRSRSQMPDPDARASAIAVIIVSSFLSIVLLVSLFGFIISLFSGNSGIQTVETESADAASVSSSVSSEEKKTEKQTKETTKKTEKKEVHLLPDDVKNDSYTRYSIDQNTFTHAMASSFISAKLTHGSTELAFDGNIETSWQEGVKGYGVGEWLLAYNPDGSTVKVSEVTIYNGYQNPKFNTAKKDMYLVNSRVSDFTLTFDDGTSESFTLEDEKDPQTFTFKTRDTCFIRFTVGGVYKGTKYKDTCISEIIYK